MQTLFSCLTAVMLVSATETTTVVTYPSDPSTLDSRFSDLEEILRMALENTVESHGGFELRPSKTAMNEARYLQELRSGGTINVAWSSTSKEKEQDFLPIRVPLRKGILGYRIALIHQDNQETFRAVKTLDDLRQLRVVQGRGWGDVAIYQANEIPVDTASYDSLFRMIDARRADLFPRGMSEIYTELSEYKAVNPHLAVEASFMIHYPWPYYFFTHRDTPELAERLEAGLMQMVEDGSLDDIFMRENADDIRRANLGNRTLIKIENHFLPEATPLNDRRLWFDPFEK